MSFRHATQLIRTLAEHRALLGRDLAHHVHNLRDLALFAEQRHACRFELLAVGRGGDQLLSVRLKRIELFDQSHMLPFLRRAER